MTSWRKLAISSEDTVRKALEIIDKGGRNVALVIDEANKLQGIVTDGDIRRGLLRGAKLENAITGVYNSCPITVPDSAKGSEVNQAMRRHGLSQIPLVDGDGHVVRMCFLEEFESIPLKSNLVVLMAGGRGSRLKHLAEKCPKPLLEIGGKPILETIIESFQQYGFINFVITVNYMAIKIKEYFGDGSKYGVHIDYIEESEPLGTAGALSMLHERPEQAFFVMNSDLLTKVKMHSMLDYHLEHDVIATMGVREYTYQVPYGVVRIKNDYIESIEEKPVHQFFVNSGIYVLDPACLDFVPKDRFFDMTTLFDNLIAEGQLTCSFPIMEYWLDIGRMQDFDQARCDFETIFGG